MDHEHTEHTVSDMANEVLVRQAKARAKQTGETFEEALEAVLETEAGSQLRDLREGPAPRREGGRVAGRHRSRTVRGTNRHARLTFVNRSPDKNPGLRAMACAASLRRG